MNENMKMQLEAYTQAVQGFERGIEKSMNDNMGKLLEAYSATARAEAIEQERARIIRNALEQGAFMEPILKAVYGDV